MFRRPCVSIAVLSILCGALVFFLFYISPGLRIQISAADCAVLAVDESQNDRYIREILEKGGIEGLVCESSQEIPIDDFGCLKMVPLDTYKKSIESFDPRDDGYAAKLRSFFVRDGKRFFFLLLDAGFGNRVSKLKNQVASLLHDIPFTFTVLQQSRPFLLYFIVLAAACISALYLSRSRRLFVFQIPVLLAFGWGGSYGFVLAAALSGIWELLREPLGEVSASRRYELTREYAGAGLTGLWERLKPFRLNVLLILFFMVFIAVFFITGNLPAIPLMVGLGCFFLLYFLAYKAEMDRAGKNLHKLFAPVPLLPLKLKTFSLSSVLLPFGAAVVLVIFLPRLSFLPFSEKEPSVNAWHNDAGRLVSSGDYYRHIDFQRSFSYTPLGEDHYKGLVPFNQEGYLKYYLGGDGLIAGSTYNTGDRRIGERWPEVSWGEAPPFPLEKLMDFLVNYNTTAAYDSDAARLKENTGGIKEWILAAVIFAVCILDLYSPLVQTRKTKRNPAVGDKWIAAWQKRKIV